MTPNIKAPSVIGILHWYSLKLLKTFARAVFFSLVLLGLAAVLFAMSLWFRPDLSAWAEGALYKWTLIHENTQAKGNERRMGLPLHANFSQLTEGQTRVVEWIGKKYRVAPEAIAGLVLEAAKLSLSTNLSPNLILGVIAIESNFHPYIQSQAGAEGLMQVMPKIHAERYKAYGGKSAAFDPVINMRVGVNILVDFIKLKDGSVDEGLRAYFGGGMGSTGQDYVTKVRVEELRLDKVYAGQVIAFQ